MNNQEDKGRLENKSKPNKKGNGGEKEATGWNQPRLKKRVMQENKSKRIPGKTAEITR